MIFMSKKKCRVTDSFQVKASHRKRFYESHSQAAQSGTRKPRGERGMFLPGVFLCHKAVWFVFMQGTVMDPEDRLVCSFLVDSHFRGLELKAWW